MNTKFKLLSLASITLAMGVSLQPASAQQKGGARFNFAPNIYRLEERKLPEGNYQQPADYAVKSGRVPSSKDILGIDPGSLPSAASVQAQLQRPLMQATPTHYKESFGAPANAPVMAVLPKTATPLALPKTGNKAFSANKAVSAKLLNKKNNHSVSQRVAGKLLRQNHLAGNSAGQALALRPNVASYGKNFGYEPGAFVPTASGDGMSVKTNVSGTLLRR